MKKNHTHIKKDLKKKDLAQRQKNEDSSLRSTQNDIFITHER